MTFHTKEKTVLKKKVLLKTRMIDKIILFCLLLLFPLGMKILFDLILEVSSCKKDFVKKRLKNSQH